MKARFGQSEISKIKVETFIRDGIVDIQKYHSARYKIMWVFKEVLGYQWQGISKETFGQGTLKSFWRWEKISFLNILILRSPVLRNLISNCLI